MKRLSFFLAAAALSFSFNMPAAHNPIVRISSVGMQTQISAAGFGARFTPNISLGLGNRFELNSGAGFSLNTSGLSNYSCALHYMLVSHDESYGQHLFLSVFASATRFRNSALGDAMTGLEQQLHVRPEERGSFDYSTLRFNGGEYSLGIQPGYRFRKGFFCSASIAFGFYDTEATNNPGLTLYREDSAVSLALGAGIGWLFGNKHYRERIR